MADLRTSIQQYLNKKKSPLKAEFFINAGRKYNVDPRLLVAMTGAETSFGTAGNSARFNPIAYGGGGHQRHPNAQTAIERAANGLVRDDGYYLAKGTTRIGEIGATWAPVGAANDPTGLNSGWGGNVARFYKELGGNPNAPVIGPNAQYKFGQGGPTYANPQPGTATVDPSSGAAAVTGAAAAGAPSARAIDPKALFGLLSKTGNMALRGQTDPTFGQKFAALIAKGNENAAFQTQVAQPIGAATGAPPADPGPGNSLLTGRYKDKQFSLPKFNGMQLPGNVTQFRSDKNTTIPVVKFDGKPIHPWMAAALTRARQLGWKGKLNSGARSYDEQVRLYNNSDRTGRTVAKPGSSYHNWGFAVDVSNGNELMQIAKKNGIPIHRPMSYEDWHFEPTAARGKVG